MTEIVVAIVGAVGAAFGVAFPLMYRAHGRRLDAITDQVRNNHGTNLRDDLDFIRDLILDVKADTAWVRRDHLDLTKIVNTHLEGHA